MEDQSPNALIGNQQIAALPQDKPGDILSLHHFQKLFHL